MKAFAISTIFLTLAAKIHAAPAGNGFQAQLTFQGAPSDVAFYTVSAPTDGSTFYTNNSLSVSHIVLAGGATCFIYGIDGSTSILVGALTVDVGPPQTQVRGSCFAL